MIPPLPPVMQTCPVEFVYLRIPASGDLALREHQLHAALESALTERALGSLVGWGASIERLTGGRRLSPKFHRVDIEVTHLDAALAVLRQRLEAVGAPFQTELHYTVHGRALQQEYSIDGWSACHPTTAATSRRAKSTNEP